LCSYPVSDSTESGTAEALALNVAGSLPRMKPQPAIAVLAAVPTLAKYVRLSTIVPPTTAGI
jgi:hypothetical protein